MMVLQYAEEGISSIDCTGLSDWTVVQEQLNEGLGEIWQDDLCDAALSFTGVHRISNY